MDRYSLDPAEQKNVMWEAEQAAARLVRREWPAIARLAGRLLEVGIVGREQAIRLTIEQVVEG